LDKPLVVKRKYLFWNSYLEVDLRGGLLYQEAMPLPERPKKELFHSLNYPPVQVGL
jgi:hypothetical protein